MCGRAKLPDDVSEIKLDLKIDFGQIGDYRPRWNAAPTSKLPVVFSGYRQPHSHLNALGPYPVLGEGFQDRLFDVQCPRRKPHDARRVPRRTRRDIAAVLNDLAVKTPVSAARARAILSALFSWARGEGYLEGDNPVEGTNNPAPTVKRDRVLSDAELAAVWNACGNDTYGKIVKLLILTGARREEVGGMLWGELADRDGKRDGKWRVPGSRTKNHEDHELTLPPLAWSIIDNTSCREFKGHVFGNGSRGYANWSLAKTALDQRCKIAEPWRLHDLRRTVATRMADIGIQPHIIEAVLNHVSGHKAGVAGVYNRSAYTRDVKHALDIWADHVASIVSGEERKIMQFPPRAG